MLEEGTEQVTSEPFIRLQPPRTWGLVVLFSGASFLGSGLLFLVEPMVSKLLLPHLGGAASVWNTAIVFFQVTLLLGYGWAHISIRKLGPKRHVLLQASLLLVSLLALPIAIPDGWSPGTAPPALWAVAVLVVAVGGPFFVLSTSSPTLQRWLSFTDTHGSGDPYFLYAAGNAGSLIGLLGYPFLVEPGFTLLGQSQVWAFLYGGFVMISIAAGVVMVRHRQPGARILKAVEASQPLTWKRRRQWILLSAVASALLLGVTHHISTDIAAFPLLWVIPLAIYLLTFVIAFGPNPPGLIRFCEKAVRMLAIPVVATFIVGLAGPVPTLIPHLLFFTVAALMAHGRLASDRPDPAHLTEYFLLISIGGAIGGLLTALVAPAIFPGIFEYPLAILGAALLAASGRPTLARPRRIATGIIVGGLLITGWYLLDVAGEPRPQWAALAVIVASGIAYVAFSNVRNYAVVLAGAIVLGMAANYSDLLDARRTFFGVYRVTSENGFRLFHSGTTVHGAESLADPGVAITYFHRDGPIGRFLESRSDLPPQSIGIVGLGVGTLASYGRPGDHITFYEIDQAVADVALRADLFTYLAGTAAEIDIKVGDGRLLLASEQKLFDVIVLDAFSSDSIPVHLITQEALDAYLAHLAPEGVLAYNVSNRYLDVAPILARQAAQRDLFGLRADDLVGDRTTGKNPSRWVLLTRDPESLSELEGDELFKSLGDGAGAPLWTDSYSNVLQVIDL